MNSFNDDEYDLIRVSVPEAEGLLIDFLYTAAPWESRQVTYNVTGTTWPECDFQDEYESMFNGEWVHDEHPYLEGDDGGGTVEFNLNFEYFESDED